MRNEAEKGLGNEGLFYLPSLSFLSTLKDTFLEEIIQNNFLRTRPLLVNNNKNPTKAHKLRELDTKHPYSIGDSTFPVGMWQAMASPASGLIFKQQEIEHGSLCRKKRIGLHIKKQTLGLMYLFPQPNDKRKVTLASETNLLT